jgi:hypothetical protein
MTAMRGSLNRSSEWVVSHPVRWGVGWGVVLVLLGFTVDLAPIAVLVLGTAIGVLNIVHAKRRGHCSRPSAPRGDIS